MSSTLAAKPSAPSVIQQQSLPSVTVFWLKQEEIRAALKAAAMRLVEQHPEIEEIWLFGSLARGDAAPGSDADLLVMLSDSTYPFLERSVRYQPNFCGVGVDVLTYTHAELMQMQADGNDFLRRARAEGICLVRRMPLKTVPAAELERWTDLIAVGGDALEDSERLYDE
jgi:uncharacterized protein